MVESEYQFFVGVDWGSETHQSASSIATAGGSWSEPSRTPAWV